MVGLEKGLYWLGIAMDHPFRIMGMLLGGFHKLFFRQLVSLGHTNLIAGFSSKAGCEFTPTDEAFDIAC